MTGLTDDRATPKIDAAFILNALKQHHSDAAIVPEVTIADHDWRDRGGKGVPTRRIDALMIKGLQRTALEIKVSKADFQRDTWEKRAPWIRVTHRFIYVVPDTLDVVGYHGCGLWTVSDTGRVLVKRKASINGTPEVLPQHVVQLLAYRASGTPLPWGTPEQIEEKP